MEESPASEEKKRPKSWPKPLMKWTDLLRNIASIVGAFISVITLIILLKQNERTYRPDLILSQESSIFKVQYQGEPQSCDDLQFKDFDGTDISDKMSIIATNIGLGAAKNLELEWSYSYESFCGTILVDTLHINTQAKFIQQMNTIVFQNCFITEDAKRKADYCLPVNTAKEPVSFSLPKNYFFALHNILVRLAQDSSSTLDGWKKTLPACLNNERNLYAQLVFQDINEKIYRKRYRIRIIPAIIDLSKKEWIMRWIIEEDRGISPKKMPFQVTILKKSRESLITTIEF